MATGLMNVNVTSFTIVAAVCILILLIICTCHLRLHKRITLSEKRRLSNQTREYILNLDSHRIAVLSPTEVAEFRNPVYAGTIVFIIGDPFSSFDSSVTNTSCIQDHSNVSLVVDVNAVNPWSVPRTQIVRRSPMTTWLSHVLRPRCRILNFFTGNLCDEWRNLLQTLRKVGLADLVLAFPIDTKAAACVQNEGVEYRTDMIQNDLPGDADFGTEGFRKIVKLKLICIQRLLEEGFFVFYLDSDIVVIKNIVDEYFTLPPKDIYIQSDEVSFTSNVTNHCTGVMFLAPTMRSEKLIAESLKAYPEKANEYDDQGAINSVISSNSSGASVGILDPAAYPNGYRYFSMRSQCKATPSLIHNNYIAGVTNKIQRFKNHGLWFI